ncbi:MAG: TOBE domain-containing protein [Holophaga sp.]|nr:TOBE domain-containing protein [Holophaga sp.]
MQLSARNVLQGRVTQVTHGAVESEIVLQLSDGVEIVSTITKASAERMKLEPGVLAHAIIKASSVIIGVD